MSTEKFRIEKDIRVICVTASSFPADVLNAHRKLYDMFPPANRRRFYGISWPDGKGGILYKAAAEELHQGEAEKSGLERFTIRKGEYISELLADWCMDGKLVQKTFKKLLAYPGIDPNGYCLEMYLNEKDMRCLVPLEPSGQSRKIIPLFF